MKLPPFDYASPATLAEAIAQTRGIRTIELHSRAYACDFYARLGYRIEGSQFIEVNISHFKMVRTLAD